jgi:hypothetical protein
MSNKTTGVNTTQVEFFKMSTLTSIGGHRTNAWDMPELSFRDSAPLPFKKLEVVASN